MKILFVVIPILLSSCIFTKPQEDRLVTCLRDAEDHIKGELLTLVRAHCLARYSCECNSKKDQERICEETRSFEQ